MILKYRWTIPFILLLFSALFIAGCITTPGCCPVVNVTSCSNDSDCVPAGCCHPSGCINAAYKENCTGSACTLECSGPIDCGAGHCACVNGTCGVIPGPGQ